MSKTLQGTFCYPGGKTVISPWIIKHIPEHETYVEVFGGSASVLANKEESTVEVYNDVDSYCVEFFEAVKHHGEELAEWVRDTPYSREVFEKWADQYQKDNWPDRTVERAGRFLYCHHAAYGGKLESPTFNASKKGYNNPSGVQSNQWERKPEDVRRLQNRFRGVQIEHLDYGEIFDKYDMAGVFMYLDPPYVGVDYYAEGVSFDHSAFIDKVESLDCQWMISYDVLPDELDTSEYHLVVRDREWVLDGGDTKGSEKLVLNYDPEQTASFSEANQSALTSYGGT